ncbi:sex-regulated protein janus-A [Ptiloglossa arizonensis]|uniref:sex-regulated protein janus-A n=1 Tax=Ptiloglossa arizonensis TaxID=3350558 RepID=UPI003FA02CEE
MSELLDKIPDVEIDDSGRFKYVLIEVEDKANVESKVIVRGTLTNWHSDIALEAIKQIKQKVGEIDVECLGGGKIEHLPSEKVINVYGTSQQFGKADHEVTANILKKKYQDYTITLTTPGY